MILLQTGLIHDFYRVIVRSRMAWIATSLASLAPRNDRAGGGFCFCLRLVAYMHGNPVSNSAISRTAAIW